MNRWRSVGPWSYARQYGDFWLVVRRSDHCDPQRGRCWACRVTDSQGYTLAWKGSFSDDLQAKRWGECQARRFAKLLDVPA